MKPLQARNHTWRVPHASAALGALCGGLLLAACGLPDYRFEETTDAGGLVACEDELRNGNESDVDCGGPDCSKCLGGLRCRIARDCAGGGCFDGICNPVCPTGTFECDGDPNTECETALKADPENCGECGKVCALPHSTTYCSGGTCLISTCTPPYGDCDELLANGCETNTSSDAQHCGSCDRVCVSVEGAPFCSDSSCGIRCDAGYGDCDENSVNGCERDLRVDVKNCNGCGTVCEAATGTPWCNDGACGISDCPPGFGDCNANLVDGCEVDLTSDPQNCKDCGTVCLAANGRAACQDSACAITGCDPGFDDCNAGTEAGYADGCETNVLNDAESCGACGHVCSLAHGIGKCENGSCGLLSCTQPWADCDANGLDCEVNTQTNSLNCGGCGSNGLDCAAVWSARNAASRCGAGACAFNGCLGSFQDCNGDIALDGCESNLMSNALHCGACNTRCAAPHGTNTCTSGLCRPACGTLYGDCDDDPRTGCESVLTTDSANCGACGARCEATQATTSCAAGRCSPICNSGYLDCDSNPNNGCETDARTSKAHCGACGVACVDNHTSSNACVLGACAPACVTGYSDCDTSRANGCETLAATCSGGPTGCAIANSVFCDDFEDGNPDGWTPSGGTWTVVTDGTRVYQSPAGSYQSSGQASWGDQTVEARVKVLAFGGVGSSYRAGVLARYTSSSNTYGLALDGASDLRLFRGTSVPSGTGTCGPIASGLAVGAWFVLKLQVSGAATVRLRSYLNGALVHDCTTTSTPIAGGGVALSTYGGGTRAEFDNVVVTVP